MKNTTENFKCNISKKADKDEERKNQKVKYKVN